MSAFSSKEKAVLLIDEIDKADIEFPNDLLHELDKMKFLVYETGEVVSAKKRPIVIITSNNEKDYLMLFKEMFPLYPISRSRNLSKIINVHFQISKNLLQSALEVFDIREVPGLKKKPSIRDFRLDKITFSRGHFCY